MKKTIGILGGMGPLATLELFRRIIMLTPAKKDQEHLRIIIDNNPQIPDRTAAILGEGESPLPMLVGTARNLEKAGADLIAMPCNTAHFYLEPLQQEVHVPIIDMIKETVQRLTVDRVALLATDGTQASGVYRRACEAQGIELVYPDEPDQKIVMRAIYGIKSGTAPYRFQGDLLEVIEHVAEAGAEAMIIGCTELSLIQPPENSPIPIYDALDILAQVAVEQALGVNRD